MNKKSHTLNTHWSCGIPLKLARNKNIKNAGWTRTMPVCDSVLLIMSIVVEQLQLVASPYISQSQFTRRIVGCLTSKPLYHKTVFVMPWKRSTTNRTNRNRSLFWKAIADCDCEFIIAAIKSQFAIFWSSLPQIAFCPERILSARLRQIFLQYLKYL